MAAQPQVDEDLSQFFESYLNDREKQDLNLKNQINKEANRVFDDFYSTADEAGLRLYMEEYITNARNYLFFRNQRPTWAVPLGRSLIPPRGRGKLYKTMRRRGKRGKRGKVARRARTARRVRAL